MALVMFWTLAPDTHWIATTTSNRSGVKLSANLQDLVGRLHERTCIGDCSKVASQKYVFRNGGSGQAGTCTWLSLSG